MELSERDKQFLSEYNADKYQKPSLTTDILLFTVSENKELQLLLIKRKNPPYEDCWAIPGGFVGYNESLEAGALRELKEETGLSDIAIEQLYTFGDVDRDPRMRVVSVAYMALVNKKKLKPNAGDDAKETMWATVSLKNDCLFCKENIDLAFDHRHIAQVGVKRLIGKLSYTTIATNLLENDQCFTIAQLRNIYEAIAQKKYDVANFRRDFKRTYEDEGLAVQTGEKDKLLSKRPCATYRLIK